MTAVRTPDLQRALADYTGTLGFRCLQQVPGVWAWLTQGSLRLQLWAFGATPGRWERADPEVGRFQPEHHSVAVMRIHALHASVSRALRASGRSDRLDGEGLQLMPWGAWEFAFRDGDGHVIHCVDWGLVPASVSVRTGRAAGPSAGCA